MQQTFTFSSQKLLNLPDKIYRVFICKIIYHGTYRNARTQKQVFTGKYTFIHAQTLTCSYAYTYAGKHTHTHSYTHSRTYTHIHAHTLTFTHCNNYALQNQITNADIEIIPRIKQLLTTPLFRFTS